MRWNERQRAMLQAMGHRVLAVPGAEAAEPAAAPRPSLPSIPVRAARTAAASDLDALGLDALRERVAACTLCALATSRTQTVFGVGHPHAHWMIVGEAPGQEEDALGEPFVGASGRLLDPMLAALGLARSGTDPARSVFIANTLKCRPPRNRNPEPSETAQCLPYLERQVALVAPRIILAMGKFAAHALLGLDDDTPVGRLRGQVHRWRGTPLVVTYHPSYLLRSPAEKARAWDDLCLAASVIDNSDERPG
ncbi:MAG TPA: uracil-DNA glycosylase [Burkholderiaceae bacterium]|nr:uracil-DNA glycosylase [Burkholderiaceae bacterium]